MRVGKVRVWEIKAVKNKLFDRLDVLYRPWLFYIYREGREQGTNTRQKPRPTEEITCDYLQRCCAEHAVLLSGRHQTAQTSPNVQLPGAGRLQYITRGAVSAVISRTWGSPGLGSPGQHSCPTARSWMTASSARPRWISSWALPWGLPACTPLPALSTVQGEPCVSLTCFAKHITKMVDVFLQQHYTAQSVGWV